MKNFKTKIKIISLILIFGFLILGQNFSQASDCDDQCESKCSVYSDEDERDDCQDECEKKCEKLDEKAEAYQKLINLKNKEGDALANQINNINSQKQTTANKIDDLEDDIDSLERDIRDKEKEIKYKKELLKGLIQADYENSRRENFELSILDNTLSGVFNQNDYLDQSGSKIRELMEEIEEAKNKLQEEKGKAEDKKGNLEDKKEDLANLQSQKQSLLITTQGEEEKYRDLLARVEEQKLELFDFSEAGNTSELLSSVDNYDAPSKKDRLSTSWYYSQRDSDWANKTIGNSNSRMRDYGCAVSSVAMVFTKLGSSINPGKLAKKSIYYYDLITWPSSWSGGISLESSTYHGNVNWSTIKKLAKKEKPVIVYLRRSSGGGHYVVIAGIDDEDYIVHDPYFGPNLYLSTSKSLVGKLGTKSSVYIDQMIIYDD